MSRRTVSPRFLAATTIAVLAIQSPAGTPSRQSGRPAESPLSRPASVKLNPDFGNLPLAFEPNLGQTDARVRFLARSGGMTTFLTDTETVMVLSRSRPAQRPDGPGWTGAPAGEVEQTVVRMKLAGAGPPRRATGLDKLPGISNYLLGNDPAKWRTDVPHYARIRYESVYPGIDLVWYGNQQRVEYDFVVAPGADPSRIQVAYEGVESLEVNADGDLALRTALGEIRQQKPRVYQEAGGRLVEIESRYALLARNRVSFQLARYDRRRELRIDPVVLVYSTYLGGTGDDHAFGVAVDAAGSAYVTGLTYSPDFPVQSSYRAIYQGSEDAYVTKLAPDGNALVYSTYLGGTGADVGRGIALDGTGAAYVTGYTTSADFPTQSAYQPRYQGNYDAFVTKLTPAGNALAYSTYLGGGGIEAGYGIAVDAAGSAYVAGYTSSTNFPTQSPYQATAPGGQEAFVTKLTPTGNALAYSTYLAGKGDERALAIAVDGSGSACVTGYTSSTDFPVHAPYQAQNQGGNDVFVTRLTAAGNALVYSTYLGGSAADSGNGIAVGPGGSVYITGSTSSPNFPTRSPYQAANQGGSDVFVAKLTSAGDALVYSTYLGGSDSDYANGIAVDASGSAHVTGYTHSANFPVQSPYQSANQGGTDAFIAKLTAAGDALVFSTYLGGSGSDYAYAIAVDAAGAVYVKGDTGSTDFPTQSAYRAAFQGGTSDSFVAKLLLPAPQTTLPGIGNAANYVAGKVAAGEIIVVYGFNFGPASLAQLHFTNGVADTALANTRIYFDNVAAPMVYAVAGSPGVLSCVVPYSVAGKSSTQVQVEYNGVKGNTVAVPVVDSVPGIFSMNQSGTGGGAILNWPDYSVNSAANPVAPGGYIMAFATGEGKTDIAIDGQKVPLLGPYPKPLLAPWTATVGGRTATVIYAGSAPDSIAGLFQVNLQIPADLTTGLYDLVIKAGNFTSTAGLTVAVK